ncbi:MAG: M23 family metallopeptidase [Bifidobacteriaceae bacterium]|nr:M23 family metallopeptidase [Bifidobacteriaceae bacterium]
MALATALAGAGGNDAAQGASRETVGIATDRVMVCDFAAGDITARSIGLANSGTSGSGWPEAAGLDQATIENAGHFNWPLPKPVQVVRPFDRPAQPWLAGHRGVDLAAGTEAPVLAPAEGSISFNGWIVDRHVLVIRHGELASTLEPVVSDLPVGEWVAAGQIVGTVATAEATHCPGCLHWGVRQGEEYLDPALLVEQRPRAVLWE